MQFRTLPRWVHTGLYMAKERAQFRSALNLCISEDRALVIHLANRPGRPDRAVVALHPVASVQEAYERLSLENPPRFHSCYLIAATPATLAAAQSAGVAYMRMPQRTTRNERIGGRPLDFLRAPVDVFRPACEVQS